MKANYLKIKLEKNKDSRRKLPCLPQGLFMFA